MQFIISTMLHTILIFSILTFFPNVSTFLRLLAETLTTWRKALSNVKGEEVSFWEASGDGGCSFISNDDLFILFSTTSIGVLAFSSGTGVGCFSFSWTFSCLIVGVSSLAVDLSVLCYCVSSFWATCST